ncbi:MAG: HU family DNA-binding protein [Prolixibacteraceae bacterium]
MSVHFNVVARKNPQKLEDAPKYYATLNSRGKRNLRYLAHRIADKSTLNEIDVKAVLEGLIQVIPEILDDGYTVDLEEFGNFHLTCSSNPSITAEEVTAANIKKASIRFLPGKLIKDVIENIKFTRGSVE